MQLNFIVKCIFVDLPSLDLQDFLAEIQDHAK